MAKDAISSHRGRLPGGDTDFTEGGIIWKIIVFSVPIVLGELLQNLYNSVDALVLGNFTGGHALAAVTVCSTIANVIVNFFNGMSVGSNVAVSRAFGSGDESRLVCSVQAAFSFSAILGVALSAAGIIMAPLLLGITGVQPDYYDIALTYLRVYLAGVMFTVIYNNGAGVMRAVGDSRTPFRILVMTGLLNMILDLLFVALMGWGTGGAAAATVISQGISAALICRAISGKIGEPCVNFAKMRKYGHETIALMLDIGLAAGLQSSLITISNLFVVRYMNMFDSLSVAGIGVAQRLDKFIVLPAKSFGITMTTFISQNIGAGSLDRLRAGRDRCMAVSLAVTAALSIAVYIFIERCVMLFSTDPQVVKTGAGMMLTIVPMYWIIAIREVLLGFLRGCGKSRMPMIISFVGMIAFRQAFLAFTMSRDPVIENIYICYPAAWGVTLVMLFCYYLAVRSELPGVKK